LASENGLKLTRRHLWLGLPVFVLLWKNFLFPLPALDFWWHLKLGQVIATTGAIPRTDAFSFTAAGKPFIAQNWLTELIYYETYRLGGFPLIASLNALVALAGFLLIYRLCLRATSSLAVAVGVGSVGAFGIVGTIRPQTMSFLLFAAYYYILSSYRSRHVDRLWLLPVLMVLWVNLHGAFALGLVLMVLFMWGESLRRLAVPSATGVLTGREFRKVVVVFILSALATLLNPEGLGIYDYVRSVMADTASQRLVAEWQPPRINELSGILLFYVPFFAAILAFAYSRRRPDWTEMTLFLAFAAFGLTALRNGAWFAMITYPLLARYLSFVDFSALRAIRRFRVMDRLASFMKSDDDEELSYSPMNLFVATVAGLVLILQSPWVQAGVFHNSLIQRGTPVAAVEFISEHHLTGNIFHPQIFGDYLIWRLWPAQRSFFDGRVHIFGEEFVREYQRAFRDSHWEELLARWNIRYLLLSKSAGERDSREMIQSARASGHWKVLYEDEDAVLFESSGSLR
jgi:hypothetical protein